MRRSGGEWDNAIVTHVSSGATGVDPEMVVRFPCGGWKKIWMPLVAIMVRPLESRDVFELMHHRGDSDSVEDSEAVALNSDSSACSDSELVSTLLEIESSLHGEGMPPVRQ